MSPKELCLTLAYSETEEEIIGHLRKEKYWDDDDQWRFFGDKENNWPDIGNQQSKPEAALVEKITNSVDAMLTAECLKLRIKPTSEESPRDLKEAQEKFFGINDGKLSNITPKERSKMSENIMLIATGQKTNPCYIIADKGEGQTPERMPETFLSLGKSNKLRIPFVQGKFNMGGTGVLRFCGKHNLQLIISKRHPEIAVYESDKSKDFWGFTIVRRENPSGNVRNSTYKYLAPNNKIISFESDGLKLLPGKYPEPYSNYLYYGTYIKLYEYQMTGLRTSIYFDPYYRFSLLMPNIALPVKLYERRKGYSAHTYETTLAGLSVRLEDDKSNNIEENYPTSGSLRVSGQIIKYLIYVFKKGKSENYTKDEGIIFTVNGQTHGHLSKAFFTRKGVGLGYLADSILVILDCTEIEGRQREDLFMNSRDRLSNCALRYEIESNLEDILKNHPGLRELKERRRREEIQEKLDDDKPLANLLEKVINRSPALAKLLQSGNKITNPFNLTAGTHKNIFVGKEFPTYFTLITNFTQEDPKHAHLKSKFRIQYKTDVCNDYFSRDKDQGKFKLYINEIETEDYSLNLWNGVASLNVPIYNYGINTLLKCKSIISDVSRAIPFEQEFYIKIVKELNGGGGGGGIRIPPTKTGKGNESVNNQLSLPNIIEIRRDKWEENKFDKFSALRVNGDEESGYDFFVNMDNIYFLTELKNAEEIKIIAARYKYSLSLIGLAILNNGESEKEVNLEKEENIFEIVYNVTKMITPILLPMIATMGSLELEDIEETMSVESE